jgi:tRNA A-37 threonylcarbamoyl transferase component Bud32
MQPNKKRQIKKTDQFELIFECAPLGKLARAAHHHLSEKPLPKLFVLWSMISMIPALMMAVLLASQKFMQDIVTAPLVIITVNVILILILIPLLKVLFRPTHVGFSAKGVRWLWKRTFTISSTVVRWDKMQKISVIQPDKTASAEQQMLYFQANKENLRLPIKEVDTKFLPVIYDCITKCAPNVERDPAVASLLGADQGSSSYTELWLSALTAPPARNRMTPLEPGTRLHGGEYLVGERIGAGGQGVAYIATTRDASGKSETVVLKEYIMPVEVSQTARRQAVEKLQKEAQILERISHPQIVRMIDLIFEDHRGYLVMEHVDGDNLSKLVKERGPMPDHMAVNLALQMCTILAHLHQQDPPVIHRDFTPDNLILNSAGILKLIDFNVAEQKKTTTTATVVGKHAYIAPEQFRGQPTPQSDIYSLGASLYYMLTGADPKPISVAHPRQKVQTVSETMDTIVARCTAIDTNTRFQSASDVATAFATAFNRAVVASTAADGEA